MVESDFTDVPSGTYLVEQGNEWRYFSVVIAGRLKVKTSPLRTNARAFNPGHWFGNLISHKAPATIEATEDTLLAIFYVTGTLTLARRCK